jgi:hypothetical protein
MDLGPGWTVLAIRKERRMNIVVFGSFGKRGLPNGWTEETTVALLGSGDFDLTGVQPGENPRLTAVAILGSVDVVVDEGTNVALSGFSLFGSRNIKVTGGDGPTIRLRGTAILGSVNVKPPKQR